MPLQSQKKSNRINKKNYRLPFEKLKLPIGWVDRIKIMVFSVFRAISFPVYFFSFGSSIAKLQHGPFFLDSLCLISVK
jgi:hypothetical protein